MAIHALELRDLHRPHSRPAGLRPVTAIGARRRSRRWAAYGAIVILGIGLFTGLDHLRAGLADAVVGGDGPVVAQGGATVALPVAAGDSLWSIAVTLRPGEDPRPLVDELARLNGGSGIEAGGWVLVPADWAGPGLP